MFAGVEVAVSDDRIIVRPWADPVVEAAGFDPRSAYVERFWLGLLGPSATWLMRRLVAGLEACPAGFELDVHTTAAALGLKARGSRLGVFGRTLDRLARFGALRETAGGELEVRRKLAPLTRGQLRQLPVDVRQEHQRWLAVHGAAVDEARRRRARRLALSLLELGEDCEATERQLHRWRYSPMLAREATAWAWKRHREAVGAA